MALPHFQVSTIRIKVVSDQKVLPRIVAKILVECRATTTADQLRPRIGYRVILPVGWSPRVACLMIEHLVRGRIIGESWLSHI